MIAEPPREIRTSTDGVRTVQAAPFKHVLVPTDFGESSERALARATEIATRYGAALTLLHTYEIPAYAYPGAVIEAVDLLTPIRDAAQAEFDEVLKRVRAKLPNADGILCMGNPWQEIVQKIIDSHADLVVMGTHGRQGVSRVLIGSVAEKVVRASSIPVLTVH